MFVKKLSECKEFISGDGVILREIIHPEKQKIQVSYSLAHAVLKHGQESYSHFLKTAELYYIIEGCGIMYVNDEMMQVEQGYTVYIPPNAIQHIKNTGKSDLVFLCIVDPPWKKEDEVIIEERKNA